MKTVLAFGTFDGLHPGHLHFLEEAKKLGDRLVVVVARDINVRRIKSKPAKFNEEERKEALEYSGLVDKAILGHKVMSYEIINEVDAQIIALGYDQEVDMEKLKKIFAGQIVRLEALEPEKYKSSKLNDKVPPPGREQLR